MTADLANRKDRARRRLRLGRRTRGWQHPDPDADAAGLATQLAGLLPDPGTARCITAYLPYPTEPNPTGVFAVARQAGLDVLLPRVTGPHTLAWVPWHEDVVTAPGAHGVPEPHGEPVAADAAGLLLQRPGLMIIPALAADSTGARLGQGGGYFDRMLARIPRHRAGGPLRAVAVFDDEVLQPSDIPVGELDARVDVIVTPTRTIVVRPPGGRAAVTTA